MKRYIHFCIGMVAAVHLLCHSLVVAADSTPPLMPALAISELQVEGADQGTNAGDEEFVELRNPHTTDIDVTDWHVEYLSATHRGSGPPTRLLATLHGTVSAQGFVLVANPAHFPEADLAFQSTPAASSGQMARSGGQVRITDTHGAVIDLLAWGSAVAQAGWPKLSEIPAANAAVRLWPGEPGYVNGREYIVTTTPVPQYGDLITPLVPRCNGLVVSELLPNPEGSDTGNEFIEIYNPTDQPQSMKACSLRLGQGKSFALPDEILPSSSYRAFYDDQTGIHLPNASPQPVWLITSEEENAVDYPENLSDGWAWAYIDANWQATMRPTPQLANLLEGPAEPIDGGTPEVEPDAAACPAGKERNPATNRCRTVAPQVLPAACNTGQIRNPATGRCVQTKTTTANNVTPCKPSQERNPETNRCRAVLAATAEAKPCAPGQERNPETNRCRKATASSSQGMAKVEDVAVKASETYKWWAIGIIVAGAIGYAVYEWRTDARNALHGLHLRLKRSKGKGS